MLSDSLALAPQGSCHCCPNCNASNNSSDRKKITEDFVPIFPAYLALGFTLLPWNFSLSVLRWTDIVNTEMGYSLCVANTVFPLKTQIYSSSLSHSLMLKGRQYLWALMCR